MLLSTGVDHTAQDLDGLTAADLAEECGHTACADFLRDYEPPPMPDIMVVLYTTVKPKDSTQVPYTHLLFTIIEVSLILFIVVIITSYFCSVLTALFLI